MDSMDLEREKGITIQSAATFCQWNRRRRRQASEHDGAEHPEEKEEEFHINIIDTPGHVDFTIEVERALRVLDGGILVLCGVSGVQSQSLTVDRQMKRYQVPRLAFVNKLDRQGCNPDRVVQQLRDQLKLNAAAVQVPMGLEDGHRGVIDLVAMESISFEGDKGEIVKRTPAVPSQYADIVQEKRQVLLERLADADDEIAELFLEESEVPAEVLRRAIRRAVIAHKFVPVFMGSAFKNKGVQPLLDGVVDYLPAPIEKPNFALDRSVPDGEEERRVPVSALDDDPLLALAFKLDETPFGQLTYVRVYQGTLRKGQHIINVSDGKKTKLSRIVRMHADEMQDITEAGAGEVAAMFGVECRSMDTFTDRNTHLHLAMSSMHVPEPVMSLSVKPAKSNMLSAFSKALNKFGKEDPTLVVHVDSDTKETILSGMGELHLQVYIERMNREYGVECITGPPLVKYKETIGKKQAFDWLHKKQVRNEDAAWLHVLFFSSTLALRAGEKKM
jgi:elongation factor G